MQLNDNKEPVLADASCSKAPPSVSGAAHTENTGFQYYLFMHSSWFLIFGVQIVLFPYLVRVELGESEIRLGLAQAALQLPTTLFLLIGGFVADRLCGRQLMIWLYTASIIPFATLAFLVASGNLNYWLLISYALAVGTIGAFALPARDALLSHVAPAPTPQGIQKAVSIASIGQFAGQILGMALAAMAAVVGIVSLLGVQAGLLIAAAFAGLRINPRMHEHKTDRDGAHPFAFMIDQISGGLKMAFTCSLIGPTMVLAFATGICFMGAFMVILPLIVESYFAEALAGGNRAIVASALGLFSLCFWTGTIISALLLLMTGTPARNGRAYILAMATGGIIVLSMYLPMPFWLLCGLNFIWGLAGGVAMVLSRGIVQAAAPPEARARVLSIFSLGFMGGAPIGAVLFGFISGYIGPLNTALVPGAMMLITVACVAMMSKLWAHHQETSIA